ncbi:threonine transporter RhtB [Skermanella stibiiresistens SB22]|uniref:Threonine transporter RhtB n=1 Tax=Skermanella stibiiresistens SB22 TaxID=1385369 RepID=W9H4N9_9PROT|nr:LysE family translocator [Skermanella stibiiresistens]EWY39761.1 threonine transporter RhtB [Skermanella stibiiresistens SB22]
MTTAEALIAFTIAAALVTITPGLDTALVLRTAAVEGGRRAFLAGVGVCVGCLAWGLIAAFGLGALLAASETGYAILRWAGAGYLLYLGGRMVLGARSGFDGGVVAEGGQGVGTSARGWFVRGFATNILNPKVGVFYVTFLPQFVPFGVEVVSFTVLLALIHAIEGILWFGLLITATRPLARALHRPGLVRALDRVTGGVLIAFGVKLILDARRP